MVEDEMIPVVGILFDSMEEAENFYREYVKCASFDVRRGGEAKKDGVITWKRYFCSKKAGLLRTTSRSESENSFFSRFLNNKVSLVEFWIRFEYALDSQRHKELKDDNETMHTIIELKTNSSLEKHAREVFTHSAFGMFQHEILVARDDCAAKSMKDEDSMKVITIGDMSSGKIREMYYDASSKIVKCSCKLFKSKGIPYRHILFVLKGVELKELPSKLILEKWTKMVTRKTVFDHAGHIFEARLFDNVMSEKVAGACSNFQECLDIATQSDENMQVLTKILCDYKQQRGTSHAKNKAQEFESYIGSNIPEQVDIHPPNQARTKESGKIIEGGLEKAMEQRKKTPRLCKACGDLGYHDSRNCPNGYKQAGRFLICP